MCHQSIFWVWSTLCSAERLWRWFIWVLIWFGSGCECVRASMCAIFTGLRWTPATCLTAAHQRYQLQSRAPQHTHTNTLSVRQTYTQTHMYWWALNHVMKDSQLCCLQNWRDSRWKVISFLWLVMYERKNKQDILWCSTVLSHCWMDACGGGTGLGVFVMAFQEQKQIRFTWSSE